MTREELLKLLKEFKKEEIDERTLSSLILSDRGFEDLGHTKVDTARQERTGFPEVVYCSNKENDDLVQITRELHRRNGYALLTRASRDQAVLLQKHFPDAVFHERAGLIVVGAGMERCGLVSVLTGGTSDIPVAEEAAVTAEVFGSNVQRIFDVGVAGIHRLISHRTHIEKSNVIVAVAGMEGALPSVVGGLFPIPVIGVPTSVGYGSHLGGITPLLTMLNSCSPGVSVVNIDNGFGAGYLACLINRKIENRQNGGTSP
jgi:NCAIR mutase (PurE)-related protein